MIQVECPGCRSKLNAKDELAGQTRKCPKCGAAVLIPERPPAREATSATASVEAPSQAIRKGPEEAISLVPKPKQLASPHRYLICDSTKIVAAWEDSVQGWMLRSPAGFVSLARNTDKVPSQGDFKLIELRMEQVDDTVHLVGITVYQMAKRWALANLHKTPNQVISAGLAPLSKAQKNAVHRHLREQVPRHIWEDASAVIEYLTNTDYHSPGTMGEA